METEKVRIAIMIDNHGEWVSNGWSGASDDELTTEVESNVYGSGTMVLHFIEVEVPIPEHPQTEVCEGQVVQQE